MRATEHCYQAANNLEPFVRIEENSTNLCNCHCTGFVGIDIPVNQFPVVDPPFSLLNTLPRLHWYHRFVIDRNRDGLRDVVQTVLPKDYSQLSQASMRAAKNVRQERRQRFTTVPLLDASQSNFVREVIEDSDPSEFNNF